MDEVVRDTFTNVKMTKKAQTKIGQMGDEIEKSTNGENKKQTTQKTRRCIIE